MDMGQQNLRVCFVSHGPFPDGPVRAPVLESDAVNIAYALGGSFLSYYSLRRMTPAQMAARLQSFDLVIAALEVDVIELIWRLMQAQPGKVATYSEGHVGDYQRLSPAGQALYLAVLRMARIHLSYWEKYLPFYAAVSGRPAAYLPYPYLLPEARRHALPAAQRPSLLVVPTGLAGHTRNGLASLTVTRALLDQGLIGQAHCWPDSATFGEDVQAVSYLLSPGPTPPAITKDRFPWRRWLQASRVDYRALLRLRARLRPRSAAPPVALKTQVDKVTFFRRTGWQTYLADLGQARLLVDLNNRETVGRNAIDCAALGVPCVSTDRSDMQARHFPRTTLADSWDIPAAIELCRRLLTDAGFYHEVVEYAAEKVEAFALPGFVSRFADIVENYQLAGLSQDASLNRHAHL
jgi:hypothetical protein